MSAPSFKSFPPSFSSFPELEPGPSKPKEEPKKKEKKERREKEKESTKGSKDRKHHDKDKDRKHSRRETDEDSGSRKHKSKKHKHRDREPDYSKDLKQDNYNPSYQDSQSLLDGKPLFFSDGRGDALNVTYGSIHAGDVPKYYPVARGRKVMGLPALTAIHKGHHSIVLDVGSGRRKTQGLTDSSSRHLLQAPPKRRLIPVPGGTDKSQEVDGFIRISSRKPRSGDPSYRAITEGKHDSDSSSASSPSGSEDEGSSSDDSDTVPETSLQATLRSLGERVASDPSSIPTWLSLLSHTLSTIPTSSKNATKARSEISVSILSKALKGHPTNTRSRSLRLKYLQAGSELWTEEQTRTEWEEALKYGGNEIWLDWLDWRIRRVERDLDGIVESAKRAYAVLGMDEMTRLRVFWRVAVAFSDAGYTERAMAAFQAQAELTYHQSSSLRFQTEESKLDALEEFWDSETTRIGEPEAKGWAAWFDSGKPEPITFPPSRKAEHDISHMDPYIRWSAQELQDDKISLLPRRTVDEDEGSDPYSTILFSDIRPLLFSLTSVQARRAFRIIWLSFLGLNIPGFVNSLSETPTETSDDRWASKHLNSEAFFQAIFPSLSSVRRITGDSELGVLIGREPEYCSVFGPVKNSRFDVLKPLDIIGKTGWTVWDKRDVEGVDEDIVREVFRMCRFQQDETEWDDLMLAFETAVNPKNAVKKSKTALAKSPDSLPRWAAHARIERIRGRFDDTRKVYQNVLSSTPSPSSYSTIWWDWAELEWLSNNPDAALQVILRSSGTHGTGGIVILRAKRHMDDLINQIPTSQWKDREGWIKLRALLELLSSSIRGALSYLDTALLSLSPGSTSHESLTIAVLLFVYYDGVVLKDPIPPSLLRERAEQAIGLYPNNTIVLGFFLESQKGERVWGRMRALLGEHDVHDISKEKGVARRIADVWIAGWEKDRWEAEIERTRNGLSNAVLHER
ncbi:hypothetical protein QCA50_002086 [Cerrena zonata]|uniref:DUF1740-domain-containing protein n=1 Tax=Cerrena zonata TaxID=2478898 RepID=A0AAW0GNF9_9APHY